MLSFFALKESRWHKDIMAFFQNLSAQAVRAGQSGTASLCYGDPTEDGATPTARGICYVSSKHIAEAALAWALTNTSGSILSISSLCPLLLSRSIGFALYVCLGSFSFWRWHLKCKPTGCFSLVLDLPHF